MAMTETAEATKPIAGAERMRLLHTMLRVRDLDASLKFYTDQLGMKLLRKRDYPSGKFTLAFVGYGDEADNTVIELTWAALLVTSRLGYPTSTRPASASPRPASKSRDRPGRWRMAALSLLLSRTRTAIGSSWSSVPNYRYRASPPRSQICRRGGEGVHQPRRSTGT